MLELEEIVDKEERAIFHIAYNMYEPFVLNGDDLKKSEYKQIHATKQVLRYRGVRKKTSFEHYKSQIIENYKIMYGYKNNYSCY